MMWILFTEGAALCMAFAAVMAKTGSKHGNYALSVAVAGTVLCVLSYFTSVKPITLHAIMKLDLNTWIFLILSGVATGGMGIYFFKSLQGGPITKVVPILKLSMIISVIFTIFVLKGESDINKIIAIVLVVVGCVIIVAGSIENFQWVLYAFIASLLLCITSLLDTIGLANIDAGFERFIVYVIAAIMFWVVVFLTGGTGKLSGITFPEGINLVLSGAAAAIGWNFYDRAIDLTTKYNVEAIYRFDLLLLVVLAGLFTDEKPTGKTFCGVIVYIMGLEILLLKVPLTTLIK